MRFYTTFKNDTKKADFIDMIKNPRHRITINKFRLGNHHLRIETGRHSVPKTPEHEIYDYVILARQIKLKMNSTFYSPVIFMVIYVQNYLMK